MLKLLSLAAVVVLVRSECHWDADHSNEIEVSDDGLSCERTSEDSSWDLTFTSCSCSEGIFEFSVCMDDFVEKGNSNVFDVMVSFVPDSCCNLADSELWRPSDDKCNGWSYISNGWLQHSNVANTGYGDEWNGEEEIGTVITGTVNFDTNKMSFKMDGEDQGVAYEEDFGTLHAAIGFHNVAEFSLQTCTCNGVNMLGDDDSGKGKGKGKGKKGKGKKGKGKGDYDADMVTPDGDLLEFVIENAMQAGVVSQSSHMHLYLLLLAAVLLAPFVYYFVTAKPSKVQETQPLLHRQVV